MKNVKLTNTKNEQLVNSDKDFEGSPKKQGEPTSETTSETTSENNKVKNSPKKCELTNREYSTLLDAANANGIDYDTLKAEAVKRLKAVIDTAYENIKRLHDSDTPVSDFIRMSRADQSNRVLQISSGSLEQRLGYDRETYTSVKKATTPAEAVLYTLLACIGWDATARLCGINDAPTAKKTKSETTADIVLSF